jgi:hypothetical protein
MRNHVRKFSKNMAPQYSQNILNQVKSARHGAEAGILNIQELRSNKRNC